jgi:hypothetical protein
VSAPVRRPLVFELPLPPANVNARGGWKGSHFRRKRYWQQCDNTVTLKKNPLPPYPRPWLRAQAVIELRTFNPMDQDNAEARLKDALDWLQSRGYVVNDRHLTYSLTQRVDRKNRGLTLTLEEVPDAAP